MKVSVIIPVFNEEKYIKACLDSLHNQIEPADEIILVDNNCTDKTINIAKNYPVKIIKEEKQGMIYARNKGFDNASYEIIARTDADAIVPPYWIKKIKKNFEDAHLQALVGTCVFYDYIFCPPLFIKLYWIIMKYLLKGETLTGPNMIIKKDLWKKIKNDICIDDKKVHEDIDLSCHILKRGIQIKRDNSLVIKISGRRIKNNPLSFFIEYPIRLIKTILRHKS